MSINWVMLSPSGSSPFTPLPGEQILYTSPPRIAFAITTPTHYPGKQQPAFTASSSSGHIYLTTRRIVYLPSTPTDKLQSFTTSFLSLHDAHVSAPFFGPNVWQALLQPVPNGGIPIPSTGVVEIRLTFKEGGAFDFHSKYEQLKERAQQAAEAGSGAANGVDLDDLPAYSEQSDRPLMPAVVPQQPPQSDSREPDEPPPQYEESEARSRTVPS